MSPGTCGTNVFLEESISGIDGVTGGRAVAGRLQEDSVRADLGIEPGGRERLAKIDLDGTQQQVDAAGLQAKE